MKTKIFSLFFFLFFLCLTVNAQTTGKYVLVIHGGAGGMDEQMPDSLKQLYLTSLDEALEIGSLIMASGGSSIDAVEKVINYLEDNPLFNAGKGAVLTSEGKAEMDAAIMSGKDLSCGSVTGLKTIKNPISLARAVMEKSPHVFLAGLGAEKFAKEVGIKSVNPKYFIENNRYEKWIKERNEIKKKKKGTVGAVALDKYGNLAAATSTGGMSMKKPGRVGDAPIIGAGTYANNKTCAVSCTGWGEKFIKNTVAFNVSAMMEYKNMSLNDAANEMIHKRLNPNDGGLIAVDKDGNFTLQFNTQSMLRGFATSDGKREVKIWGK
ncbi:MAG: isoaspartyl peptidase/L-asparaginase [Ignavibacteriaceae bacterium]|jgi:beta-aspartyl-peptidase (threonine type)|nr:isoaspartyl peptidase/L-asparaginase [Ignavibacteriaceae bacterium]